MSGPDHTAWLPGVPVSRAFFARPSVEVAPDLLGKVLAHVGDRTAVRIVETEAYDEGEPACHAHNGQTQRNAQLFGPPGHAYVYFTYGMHWCANTVTGRDGRGEGVLLRAAAAVLGVDLLCRRRGSVFVADPAHRDLLRGPARLTKAMGLDRANGGDDLTDASAGLVVLDDGDCPADISAGPRVGVRLAADVPWRFWITQSPLVSDYSRHPKAAPPAG